MCAGHDVFPSAQKLALFWYRNMALPWLHRHNDSPFAMCQRVNPPDRESSFGSLLAAIDFIIYTLPARGDASGAAWTVSSGSDAGVDDRDSVSQSVTWQ